LKRNFRFYRQLFFAVFSLSAFTLGGGYVIVPLMKKRFVEHYHWIDEGEMLDMVAIAQSSPGAIAVNASILLGYRLAGIPGALITTIATVLPPMVILSVISLCYTAFRNSAIVSYVLAGMQAGVAAVIASVVVDMAGVIFRKKNALHIAVMLAVFAASAFFKVNVVLLILGAGMIGFLELLCGERRAKS